MIKVRLDKINSAYAELHLEEFPTYVTFTDESGVTRYTYTTGSTGTVRLNGDDSLTVKVSSMDYAMLYEGGNVMISRYDENGELLNSRELTILEISGRFVTLSTYNIDTSIYCGKGKFIDGVKLSVYNGYLSTSIPLSQNASYNSLYQQENIDLYFDKLVENAIPKIIDTERIKYIPYCNGKLANKLEFNFHFRRRNTDGGKYKMSDNWDIETENNFHGAFNTSSDGDDVHYWNTFKNYDKITSSSTDLYNSDLLGFLGFTDNDVYNKKQKLKKSFIRLSFYATNNPVENSLLFYSTIFFNTNKLYTNYINLLNNDNYPTWKVKYLRGESGSSTYNYWGLVFFDGSDDKIDCDKLLSSRISVTNEYDKTTSAEGYNLYLYKADAEFNDERTIYMKVEFNHAGYGRTIPMVLWPQNGSSAATLTTENCYDQMYIPVHLKYDSESKRFIYYFDDYTFGIKNNTKENTIQFALFEPKLEPSINTTSTTGTTENASN